jgi:hypothetical protein
MKPAFLTAVGPTNDPATFWPSTSASINSYVPLDVFLPGLSPAASGAFLCKKKACHAVRRAAKASRGDGRRERREETSRLTTRAQRRPRPSPPLQKDGSNDPARMRRYSPCKPSSPAATAPITKPGPAAQPRAAAPPPLCKSDARSTRRIIDFNLHIRRPRSAAFRGPAVFVARTRASYP